MSFVIKKNFSSIKDSLKEIFKELDFEPGKRVYIKPNLCGRFNIIPGENSSFEVASALVDILLEKGCEVIIGHGALLGSHDHQVGFAESMSASGFDKFAKRSGVRVINIDNLKRTAVSAEKTSLHLPINFLNEEIDTYINLAKIKTHMETAVSLSIKNQMGLAMPIDRAMMHKTGLEKSVAKLATYCKPHISILEGLPAMEGNGPHHGKPRDLGLIAAGDDMVELDSAIAQILGYNVNEIKHIKYAEEMGVGEIAGKKDLDKYSDLFVKDFRRAVSAYSFGKKFKGYPTFSCSRCINAVYSAGKDFKRHPFKYWRVVLKSLFSREKVALVFGRADDLKLDGDERVLCVGNCAKKFAEEHNAVTLNKCPPGVEEVKEFLIKNL